MLKWLLLGCVAAVMVSGCGHQGVGNHAGRDRYPTGNGEHPGGVEQQLRAEAARWLGTPYKMGGNDLNGVDCSGLVQGVYQDLFGVQMPRTARAQATRGQWVSRSNLGPADLVFFKPSGKKDHVGIYLGGGEFVHASGRKGVSIARLDLSYWRKCYWTARRIPLR